MRLSNLHWLPVRKRIDFKLALTTYKILSTHQPAYLRSLLFPHESCTRALPSSSQQVLNVTTVTTDLVDVPLATVPPRFGMKFQPP